SLRQSPANQDHSDGLPEADGRAVWCRDQLAHGRWLPIPHGRGAAAESSGAPVLARSQCAGIAAVAAFRPRSSGRRADQALTASVMPVPVPDPESSAAAVPSPTGRIPYAFARTHGVLALRDDGDAILVLARN